MPRNVSPGVERAVAAVGPTARLADWLRVLLADDDGRPAQLLMKLRVDVLAVRDRLSLPSPVAPSSETVIAAARRIGLTLRADPEVTTDVVFLAVLDSDEAFVESIGIPVAEVRRELSPLEPTAAESAPFAPTSDFFEEPALQPEAARVLDASLNRAREGLRVLDDYARFVLNDATLTGELKRIRHELADATHRLPASALQASRDTLGDIGTAITGGAEYERESVRDVAGVNVKRVQEALRSCEEFGKLLDAEFARRVEQLRYATYSLETALLRGSGVRDRLASTRLYVLLTGSQCVAAMDWTIAEAAAGGTDVFQLREKALPDRELLTRARDVRRWTRKAGVLFVVNDRPDIARLADADGVHLGQDDVTVAEARRIVGPDVLIGVSTHTIEQVRRAVLDGADYLGVGPTYPSRTKAFDEFPGLAFVAEAFAATSLPAFALGGIDASNVGEVVAAGANRVAVASAVTTTDEPRLAAAVLKSALVGTNGFGEPGA